VRSDKMLIWPLGVDRGACARQRQPFTHHANEHNSKAEAMIAPAARTGSPSKDIVADTRANIDYVKKTFRMPLAQ
jgi:hypothetical protein